MIKKITTTSGARHFATILVIDMARYNQDKIKMGFKHDSLFSILSTEIEFARKLYNTHVDPSIRQSEHIFNSSLVDILLNDNGQHIDPSIW